MFLEKFHKKQEGMNFSVGANEEVKEKALLNQTPLKRHYFMKCDDCRPR